MKSVNVWIIMVLLLLAPWIGHGEMGAPAGATLKRMKAIIIPKVDFKDAPVGEVMKWLSAETKKYDPLGAGVQVSIDPITLDYEKHHPDERETLASRKISLKLENQTLFEIVRVMTSLAGGRFKIGTNQVYIGWIID